ncbi:bifunctional DNA primase/polymerase [Mycobacterium sp. 94-17]|uniref:bifunctional DNA primase/polymerase n=1 Tax=Mycobacterium sp. 94-17 TaxID=2986147 RepID=UPI002D1E9C47|nr:bifunctional DNA primase/polymerase [Mycobacterium sp. 94-17]MEB4208752.1 bifunctional DNA primase/polymerase [Mycobacterium sp. 94-17]
MSAINATADLAGAATAYALDGKPVFPVKPRDKAPATGRGFHDASALYTQVDKWWGQNPQCNIGMPIPAGHVCVDVDRNHDGLTKWAQLVAEHGGLPSTWEADTGGGGKHYVFRTTVKEFEGRICPGVDIRAGGRHYIVVPPSIHKSGNQYRWVTPPSEPAAQAPAWLEQFITKGRQREKVPAAVQPATDQRESAADQYSATAKWAAILPPHGWVVVHGDGDEHGSRWRRPGADSESSASILHDQSATPLLHVFSTSAEPFDADKTYTRFAAHALLNHGGDMSAAAKALTPPTDYGRTDFGYGPALNETATGVGADTDQVGVTWQPIDLGPYLRGEITPPQPTLGVARDDGQRCLYRGREHAVIGETESGKSWFCLLCAAAEMRAGNRVVYIHFEEADPSSTVERLKFLGLSDDTISAQLVFIGPAEQVRREWLLALMEPPPTLVVLDGVNEAMALHGAEIKAAEGASEFRRRLVTPFLRAGAAVLSCDHLPMGTDHTRRDAYGTVHKGNAIDGARFVLVNKEPFGRGMRGMSHVYLTKDRPGALRIHGRQTGVPGKSYFGALAIDATGSSPELWGFYPPRDTDREGGIEGGDPVAEAVVGDLAKAGGSVDSFNKLCAMMRTNGMGYQRTRIRDAVDDLVVAARLLEVPGARGAVGYRLPDATGSAGCSDEAAA